MYWCHFLAWYESSYIWEDITLVMEFLLSHWPVFKCLEGFFQNNECCDRTQVTEGSATPGQLVLVVVHYLSLGSCLQVPALSFCPHLTQWWPINYNLNKIISLQVNDLDFVILLKWQIYALGKWRRTWGHLLVWCWRRGEAESPLYSQSSPILTIPETLCLPKTSFVTRGLTEAGSQWRVSAECCWWDVSRYLQWLQEKKNEESKQRERVR